MKDEVKLALVIDDHKLPLKEAHWAASLAKVPWIKDYDFVREEVSAGPTANTTTLFRHFKLKAGVKGFDMPAPNPKLQSAMEEVSAILKKHDLMAVVCLATGQKDGEFLFNPDIPTWSKIKFEEQPGGKLGMRVGIHMKTDPEKSQRTVNALWSLQGMLDHIWHNLETIKKVIVQKVEIEESGSEIIIPKDTKH
jgi:hypothetical protein